MLFGSRDSPPTCLVHSPDYPAEGNLGRSVDTKGARPTYIYRAETKLGMDKVLKECSHYHCVCVPESLQTENQHSYVQIR